MHRPIRELAQGLVYNRAFLVYDMYIRRKQTMCYLDRLEMIDFIVVETDRDTQGDFEEDMLRDQLEAANDHEVRQMAGIYGWL